VATCAARAKANLSLFPSRASLRNRPRNGHRANARREAARDFDPTSNTLEENLMSRKQKTVVRKPSKKIADSRRVRFGGGSAPQVVRPLDAATRDSRTVRFGGGSMPASLRK
jgi:hypothetical protein